MILKKVGFEKFLEHRIYYYDEIPKAQNSEEKHKPFVFDYYFNALKVNSKNFLSIAVENGEIIGCALFRFYEQENKFFLLNVNTRKDFQRSSKKVATNVLKFGLKEFFANHNEIFLWVSKDNLIAQKLYQKFGFKQINYFPDKLEFLKGTENSQIIMQLTKNDFESFLNAEKLIFGF